MASNFEYTATISGGPYDGRAAYDWAEKVFLPQAESRLVAHTVTTILGLWEFCCFFPAEIVLWKRVTQIGRPGRTSFAPWTTLALRYLLLCFAVSNAFLSWSTTMPTAAACRASSVFAIGSGILLNSLVAFAIAWRAQAVARGVIQNSRTLRSLQVFIAVLVFLQVFLTIFSVTWPGNRRTVWKPHIENGACQATYPYDYRRHTLTGANFASDPLQWYYTITILFNLICLVIVMAALRSLASRSRGFSKFINGMRNHSLFFFFIILLCCLLAIVWRSLQGVAWLYQPTTVIEAAVMIRILLAEQDAARRPLDTTFIDNTHPVGTSRHLSTRGQFATQQTAPRGDTTIQFVDPLRHIRDLQQFQQQQSQHLQQQQQQQQPPVPRPIFQPFSVMDNLGQAFSQVDSRNPHDLDDQSLDLNHGGYAGQVSNAYPGVLLEELEREREMVEQRQLQSNRDQEKDCYSSTSDRSNMNGEKEKVQTRHPLGLPRSLSLSSTADRNILPRRSANTDNDGDDDDVGIQTVHF